MNYKIGEIVKSRRSGIIYTIIKVRKVNNLIYYDTNKDYGFFDFEKSDYPLYVQT